MDGIQKRISGVTIHLDPQADGRVHLIFAVDGQIRQEETLTRAELRSRFPALGLQILGYLGGGTGQIVDAGRRIGQIMNFLGARR